jgi:hypothetical protein
LTISYINRVGEIATKNGPRIRPRSRLTLEMQRVTSELKDVSRLRQDVIVVQLVVGNWRSEKRCITGNVTPHAAPMRNPTYF